MKTISSINIPDSASWSKLLRHLEQQIKYLQDILNKGPVITDGDNDVTEHLVGRVDAYKNIKHFVERGCHE